jgi:hypothetical protein
LLAEDLLEVGRVSELSGEGVSRMSQLHYSPSPSEINFKLKGLVTYPKKFSQCGVVRLQWAR